jgi:hypothetical protein
MITTGMLSNTLLNRSRSGYNSYNSSERGNQIVSYSRPTSIFSNYSLSNLYSYQQELFNRNIFRRPVLPVKESYADIKSGFFDSALTNDLIRNAINNMGNGNNSTNLFIYNETKGFLSHIFKGNFVNTFG